MFPYVQVEPPVFQFGHCLLSCQWDSLGSTEKSHELSLFFTLSTNTPSSSPHSIYFPRLNNFRSLSFSPQERCSSPSVFWMPDSLQNVHVSVSVESLELDPAVIRPCHKWWVEGKNYIPWCSLDLLSTLLLVQTRTFFTLFATWPHSWSIPSLVPTRISKAKLLSSWVTNIHTLVSGITLPQGKGFALVLFKLPEVPVGPFHQPGKASGSQHNHLVYQPFKLGILDTEIILEPEGKTQNIFLEICLLPQQLIRAHWVSSSERNELTVLSIGIQILYS